MNVRPFDWRDLPTLHRYRCQGLFLDSALVLTRRPSLIPTGALLTYFAPATGIFTYLCEDEQRPNDPIVGQVTYTTGLSSAHLAFLAPEALLAEVDLSGFIERISTDVAARGGMHILAEVDERHDAFEMLRRLGFAVYARQRFWRLNLPQANKALETTWRLSADGDSLPIRGLYNNLVPGLVQQIEPLAAGRPKGLVIYEGGDLLGFIELRYGPRGILAQPFIHPDAENLPYHLLPVMENLPDRRDRPVYFCVRSYQSWLEAALDDAGAQPSPRQAVMVKRLVVSRRVEQPFALPAIEVTRVEPTAPISNRAAATNQK